MKVIVLKLVALSATSFGIARLEEVISCSDGAVEQTVTEIYFKPLKALIISKTLPKFQGVSPREKIITVRKLVVKSLHSF